ncbi:MAG: CoA pyrophosphatase [Bacteroidota bacterium]
MRFYYLLNHLKNISLPGIDAHKEMSFTNRNFDKPDNAIKSAVCIFLFENNNHLFFPLIKRPTHLLHHKGQIALPGGRMQLNENIIDCALRETQEELGINTSNTEYIKTLTELYIPVSNHLVYPIIVFSSDNFSPHPDANEVDKILLCSIEDVLSFEKSISKVRITDNVIIESPAFIFQTEIIWGATALILNEFRHLLLSIPRS